MTDNNKSLIVVVFDRSGSMESIKADMIGGYANFVKEQRALPGECKISLYQFDDRFETVYEWRDINDRTVGALPLEPRGWTALLDAVGNTITLVGRQLKAMPESERPSAVIMAVITDGYENASREYTRERVREMIKHQQDKYNWRFAYLGAGESAFAGEGLGIAAAAVMSYAANSAGVQGMYSSTSQGVGSYRSAVRSGNLGASLNTAPVNTTTTADPDQK